MAANNMQDWFYSKRDSISLPDSNSFFLLFYLSCIKDEHKKICSFNKKTQKKEITKILCIPG